MVDFIMDKKIFTTIFKKYKKSMNKTTKHKINCLEAFKNIVEKLNIKNYYKLL